MKKITDNLSRIVISLSEAKNEGIVMNILLDKKFKYVLGYIIVDDNSIEEEEKYLPLKKVIEGTDSIMIVDETKLTVKAEGIKCPLNAPVYNTDGELTGSLKDVSYDETTSKILCLLVNDKEISIDELVSAGENLIIIKGSSNIKIRTYRKKAVTEGGEESIDPEAEENAEAQAQDIRAADSENTCGDNIIDLVIEAGKEIPAFKGTPQRLISDYSFLVGRKVTKNICDSKSAVLVPTGSIVNDDIVNLARHSGKLVELTVNSIR